MKLSAGTLCLLVSLLLKSQVFADTGCFIIQEKDHVLKQEGNCTKRHSPCSTFKIPISLMGFDSGILTDQSHPEWPFKPGYVDYIEAWKQSHCPTNWIKNSCIWYSQVITQKLGLEKFKSYVAKLNYGNQDISGDKGKDNGLTHSWLSSSLQISGVEQIAFLQKLIEGSLPVSPKAHQMTKNILFVEKLPHGWSLYGKRGAGFLLNNDGSRNEDRKIGWFIGWVEKGERKIVFAHYIEDNQRVESPAGKRAKEIAKEKVLELMASYASQKYEEIVTYDNDKRNILRTPAPFISEKEWDLAQSTVQKLLYVRNNILKGGAGLAAPQIGISHPIFIYTPDRTTENLRAVINPSYEPVGDETITAHEACFSIPLRCTHLKRWKKIKVRYQNFEGQKIETVLDGFAANAFQHEMDHIRGILTIDHKTANVKVFTDSEAFKKYMKQIHLEDSKAYPKDKRE